ncbi:MAG: DUF4276 family protein [Thermodesulfobacteriota bacterium]
MTRVHVICEGQTEETFVNEVLYDWFHPRGIYLFPSLIGKPGHKGGKLKFQRLLIDIRGRLMGDKAAYCTTFFDFYGLPSDFPGKENARLKSNIADKAECVMQSLSAQLQGKLGEEPLRRFIPYVQMYEFEGLLFSEPEILAQSISQSQLAGTFRKIRDGFNSPEEINDDPEKAPSKRILDFFTAYDKPVYGSLAALEIGLAAIRRECALFNGWLERIESLPTEVIA